MARGHKQGAMMRVEDNGRGMAATGAAQHGDGGLGLRNMAERMEQLHGTLRVLSSADGTVIEAQVPLSHMLPPAGQAAARKDSA